jgi:hypothetical protein
MLLRSVGDVDGLQDFVGEKSEAGRGSSVPLTDKKDYLRSKQMRCMRACVHKFNVGTIPCVHYRYLRYAPGTEVVAENNPINFCGLILPSFLPFFLL